MKDERIDFRLSKELKTRVEEFATKNETNVTSVIIEAILTHLKRKSK